MKNTTFVFTVLFCIAFANLMAQNDKSSKVKWTMRKPFEDKVFIENNGQFTLTEKGLSTNDIFFGANLDGLRYYFTKNSIWIEHSQANTSNKPFTANPRITNSMKAGDSTKVDDRLINQFHQLYFEGANPTTQIRAVDEVNHYYNYRLGDKSSVKANAYKKIIYTNLYPGIDMEFYFPESKAGFEYGFVVHPGADVSLIKIKYPSNEDFCLTNEGNIKIKSAYGDFTEQAPVASQGGNKIITSFKFDNGEVGFTVGNYDKSKYLVIDPWVSIPTFKGRSDGFYVDFDNEGNCYIYGGNYPWSVAKYNSSGNLLWVTTTSFTSNYAYLGHFGVDRVSQSVYVGEGFNTNGAEMIKLNKSGVVISSFSGNSNFIEIWRIAFSRCNPHQAVFGGGNTTNGPYNSGFVLDTTLSSITPVNILGATSGFDDVCLLTLDNSTPNSNAYLGYCKSHYSSGNTMVKAPTTNLTPLDWSVNDGYKFSIANSVDVGSNYGAVDLPNGFSGMTYSTGNDLFTYDSYTLKKWNALTGALVTSKKINTNSYGDSLMNWAGLTSDLCDNIFLGSQKNILQYDGNLNLINTISAPDTVFDVKLGNNSILYACGKGFVEAITVNAPQCISFTADTTTVNATCGRKGKASVSVNGGIQPYTIAWTALDSTRVISSSMVADSLSEGDYVVSITESSCLTERVIDTIHIRDGAPVIRLDNPNPVTCSGSGVQITATGAKTYQWSPSTGLSATTGSSVIASPTTTTTYSITGTLGNCSSTIKVVVTISNYPKVSVTPASPVICNGGSIKLTASGGTQYIWVATSDSTDTITVHPIITTTYGLIVGNGSCFVDTIITVTVSSPTPLDIEPRLPIICDGQSVDLYINGGGSGFVWSPSTGLNFSTGDTVVASPTTSITYIVTGNNSGGCPSTGVDTVIVDSCKNDVWPGDANDDLVVDNYDLIPIGLYYNEVGTARSKTSNIWNGQPATNWGTNQSNGYDKKFVDCNGDGVINSNDTLAITLNYGLTHVFHSPRGSSGRASGMPLYFIADSVVYHPGSAVHLEVWLGDTAAQLKNIYALGYDIGLDVSQIQTGTLAFDYKTSFIGTKNTDALSLIKLNNDVETAVARIDHNNKNGYGKIGDLYFTFTANISESQYIISFLSNEAVDSAGASISLQATNDTLNLATGINQLSGNSNEIAIFPNPTTGLINITSSKNIDEIKVTNVLGQLVYDAKPKQVKIGFELKNEGMYFVEVNSGNKVSSSKVIVIR